MLCSSSVCDSRSPSASPWISRVSTSRSGSPGLRAAVGDQALQVGQEIRARPARRAAAARRQHRLQRAEDGERPVAQRPALVARHGEQIADHLDRDGGGEVGDQVGRRPCCRHPVEQAVDQRGDRRLHVGDRARREGAGDDAAHARVQRRVVEHQAGGVVLVEQAVAVLRPELALLVGGEALPRPCRRRRSRHSATGNSCRPACDAPARARAARGRRDRGWRRSRPAGACRSKSRRGRPGLIGIGKAGRSRPW